MMLLGRTLESQEALRQSIQSDSLQNKWPVNEQVTTNIGPRRWPNGPSLLHHYLVATFPWQMLTALALFQGKAPFKTVSVILGDKDI
jgi:hypothetical protein